MNGWDSDLLFPDFLPVIGKSKNYDNLFYAFGHHHLGWTLGAITGKIIAKMIVLEKIPT